VSEGPCDIIVRAADQLPERDMAALAAALTSSHDGLSRLRARASSAILRTACDTMQSAVAATSASFAAGMLMGILRARQPQRSAVDVVWSGPSSSVTTSRLTSAVVVDLVDEAVAEVLLASYAMHSEPALAAALSRAVQRGVRITFVAERAADNPSFHGPRVAFAHVPARRLRWPADRRPAGACLHAKILVVDRIVALVGSANVTTSAMERNLECGVLVRDRIVAADIARHVDELVRAGELMPLPGEGQ
jgi:phosphatidylserine/phosphatidylglycerophosphate/cardiolipin synthase-like enzyme